MVHGMTHLLGIGGREMRLMQKLKRKTFLYHGFFIASDLILYCTTFDNYI